MKKILSFLILISLFLIFPTTFAFEGNLTDNFTAIDSPAVVNDTFEPSIETGDLVKYYKNDTQFEFKVLNANKTPVSGATVHLNVNGKDYNRTTNSDGAGSLKINLLPGKYKITTSYNDISVINSIDVLSRFSSKDVTTTYGTKTKFSVTLLDNQGKAMKNAPVTFKVSGKTYSAKTNSKGIASINLNLNAGTYTVTYSSDGISGKNSFKVKNYCKITTYKWKTGADVTKNKKIRANIPDSALVKKVIKAAKSGTPLIKFKGGSGKVVFITAGVHGNELSSQIAAMRLIQYLESHPIKGTVYIMPFIHPKATAKNVRNYNINLNSKANVKGTVSYKTVKLIVKLKCKAYGDFHCTKPGGKPGKDVAMGTYKPTKKSATLAKYIAKKSKVKYLIYKKAGQEYPGAMEDAVSLKGIPAVTCEVITPHGTIRAGSVEKSLSMMKSFLKFSALV